MGARGGERAPAGGLALSPSAAIAHVRRLARQSGSSFYLAFLLLPRERREAILTVYAWCRRADDIVDGAGTVEEKRRRLDAWRKELDLAFAGGGASPEPVTRALAAVLGRFPIDRSLFLELIEGVEMDLTVARYPTFDELARYAYRVASVVGLMSIEVFGYRSKDAPGYAVALGMALQLTNIVRDVDQDLQSGRIYLPLEDLARHGVSEADLLARRDSPALRAAVAMTAARARAHFELAAKRFPETDRATLFPAEVMGAVYRRLLDRLGARGLDPFGPRVTVPRREKLWIAGQEWWKGRRARQRLGRPQPDVLRGPEARE